MVSSEYESFFSLAERLIRRKGRDIEIVCASKDVPNPDRPWEIEDGREEKVTVRAVEVNLETKFVDGTQVRQTDKQLLVAAKNFPEEIKPQHFIIDRGYTFRIVKPMKVQPGPDNVLHILIVR